jgi:dihydrofolate reductase
MAARFVYWMNVSLDLMIESAPGENGGGDWMRIGEPLHREFNARARAMTMSIEGRTTYEIMESFWPAAAQDATLPAYLQEYGEIWTSMPKMLVSRTRTTASHGTRIVGDGAIDELARVRSEASGDIGVGGATLATQLRDAGLLDEVMLFTHPVILGRGRPLFDGTPAPMDLELIEQSEYADGVTLHRYALHPSDRKPQLS